MKLSKNTERTERMERNITNTQDVTNINSWVFLNKQNLTERVAPGLSLGTCVRRTAAVFCG